MIKFFDKVKACQNKKKYVIINFGAISFLRSVSGPDGSSTKYGAYVLFFCLSSKK